MLIMISYSQGMTVFRREVTQAYVQEEIKLEREVFMKAPVEMGLPEVTVLKVVKPLYGIPESALHWYLTYLDYHVQILEIFNQKSEENSP